MTEKEFHAFVFDFQINYVCPTFEQNESIQFINKNKGLTKVYRLTVRAERLKDHVNTPGSTSWVVLLDQKLKGQKAFTLSP